MLAFIIGLSNCATNNNSKNGRNGYKKINGAKIYYKITGSGSPLVVISGKPLLNHSYLTAPLQPLAKQHELVFYDQRLTGRSSADVDKSHITLKNYVDDIEGLRKGLKLGKISLLGHAWGGFLAMKYALKYPQHLTKLILSDSIPPRSQVWHEEQVALQRKTDPGFRKAQQDILSAKKYRHHKVERLRKLLQLRYGKQFHNPSYADSLKLYIPHDFAKRSRLFGNLMPQLQHFNLYPQLARLQIPTLIIYGSDEPVTKISGEKLKQTIPNSQLKIIKNAGHFPFIEKPKPYLSAVRNFLK